MDIYITPLPPKAQGSSQKREAEDYKNHRGRWMATGKQSVHNTKGQLHTWAGSCHDNMYKTRKDSQHEGGGGHEVPTLPEEL